MAGLAIWMACGQSARGQENFGERLGWAADQVVVILHCNGAGMAQGTGRGILTSVTKGVGSSYSIMMPCPWVPGFLRSRPPESVDVGVEATLTSEFDLYRWGPVAGKDAVPGLVDPDGYLWKTAAQVAAKASADDVEKEIRAQVDRAIGFGLRVTHLETLEGAVYLKPEYFARYLKVAMEKGLAPVIAGGHMTHLGEERTNVMKLMKPRAVEVWNAGFPVVDDIVSGVQDWEPGQKRAKLEAMLFGLRPGITHIIFQPAVQTDELKMIMPALRSRVQDNIILTDFGIRRVIENRKIVVTDWRELRERRKKAAAIGN